jgi:peptide/nickel transport system substrate-binding protein
MNRRRVIVATVAGTAAVALVAACSSSKSNNNGGGASGGASSAPASAPGGQHMGYVIQPGFTTKGGTVNILSDANFEHLDPVNNYVTNSTELGRLFERALTFVKDTPGQKPEIKPDLAENLGTPSADKKTWTYKLRSGLKFEDGTPITSKDIKYGVERTFATDVYKDGATYMTDLLANPNAYAGPYKDPNKDLTSVQTPDNSTISFTFSSPQPEADWIVSLSYTSPVPKAKDDKQNYDFHPVSSGPYKISSYTPDKSLTLVRNPNWDPSTDPNRPALPDSFVETFGIDLPTISQRLIADQGPDKNAVTLENSGALQNADLPKLKDPSVNARFANGTTPCVDYLVMNVQKIKDVNVRKAIAMAINRQAISTIYGGAIFGSVTDTIVSGSIQSTIPNFKGPDLGLKPNGDPAAAKALLNGQTPTIHYGVSNTSVKQKTVATQVQNDLKAAGINVVIDQIPQSSYYKTLRSSSAPDMARAGWCWDWPSIATTTPPILGGNADLTTWNPQNFSKTDDTAVFKKIAAQVSAGDDSGMNDTTNQQLSQLWPLLTTIAINDPNVVGSNIRNGGVSTYLGEIDLITIGVQH